MYNEEEVIDIFFNSVEKCLANVDVDYEIVCINDGSSDSTLEKLLIHRNRNSKIKIISFSRNFGKETALSAGLDCCTGDAAIPLDCDLQDPPELVIRMVEKWSEGYDVVLAKRIDRSSDGAIKRWTSSLFYKLIGKMAEIKIPDNIGDFRLMDRKVLTVLKQYPERSRFMKGIFASLGFRSVTIEYVRPERVAGTTKWNYFSLYKLAIEGIISFTTMPLKIWSYIGVTTAILSVGYGIFLIIKTLVYGVDTPGYASLMVVILFMSGLILMCLGILGEYISRIFIEVKQRPLYIISEKHGFDND